MGTKIFASVYPQIWKPQYLMKYNLSYSTTTENLIYKDY